MDRRGRGDARGRSRSASCLNFKAARDETQQRRATTAVFKGSRFLRSKPLKDSRRPSPRRRRSSRSRSWCVASDALAFTCFPFALTSFKGLQLRDSVGCEAGTRDTLGTCCPGSYVAKSWPWRGQSMLYSIHGPLGRDRVRHSTERVTS